MSDKEELRLIENIAAISDIQAGYRNPVTQVAFRGGFIACREIMARFVEQGGDAATAASIRANWLPQLGDDPGAPARYDFAEIADGGEEGPWTAKEVPAEIEGRCYAWLALHQWGLVTDG